MAKQSYEALQSDDFIIIWPAWLRIRKKMPTTGIQNFVLVNKRRGTLGDSEHRNTAKNIGEHRITAKKVDRTPSPQYAVLVWWYKGLHRLSSMPCCLFCCHLTSQAKTDLNGVRSAWEARWQQKRQQGIEVSRFIFKVYIYLRMISKPFSPVQTLINSTVVTQHPHIRLQSSRHVLE